MDRVKLGFLTLMMSFTLGWTEQNLSPIKIWLQAIDWDLDLYREWLGLQVGIPLSYSPFNLLDGQTNTCWAEGVKGDGSGEFQYYYTNGKWLWKYPTFYDFKYHGSGGAGVLLVFSNLFSVNRLKIINGYTKSKETYFNNARPSKLEMIFWGAKEKGVITVKIIELEDVMESQWIEVGYIEEIKAIAFTILSTYPGTRYDDTCISEIEFYYQGRKYEVVNLEEAKREFLRTWKNEVMNILSGGDWGWGYSFCWWDNTSYIEFDKTGEESGTFFIDAFLDPRGAIITNENQVKKGDKMGVTNIYGEWRFDEEGVFWTRVRGRSWKRTGVAPIAANALGKRGTKYFAGSDIETEYLDWKGPR
ncbi:NADase-type glycan-binding domain-containing protein [Thermospira aquatica]|uniref:NAD glycohydrolase translocation F5/8 type C domain-containing protein n=1 Tax=Thermospira aquatica TaxID=2828656 RepID=A0AAX3BFF3_9SPIR|nr:hypothetical protein [Thermospira aquatica]URA11012.1 hypothetical protein KDW03_04200 [Thermospira aquatica]